MRIQIRLLGLLRSDDLTRYASRRVHQHLGRFGGQVSNVVVRISDQNGPRGGRDKRCQLAVRGPRIGSMNLAETHEDVYAGVDLALGRLSHVIGRTIERSRET